MLAGQQIVLDLYNCDYDKLTNKDGLETFLKDLMKQNSIECLSTYTQCHYNETISIIAFHPHGHIIIHTHPETGFASVDIFSTVHNIALDKLALKLRQELGAQKAKNTYLKRGDFGSQNDMKPTFHRKIKPWRRVRNTGAQVLKIFVTKKNQSVD